VGDTSRAPSDIITLPQGGGAVRGIGEKFQPDPLTGTGNFSVPIVVPAGRRGMEPNVSLTYSTGSGNGYFGLGWGISVPGISRKTSGGVPAYEDDDVFVLSGQEDLVPVGGGRFRPRSEGLFAEIERREDSWLVRSLDGVRSRYGGDPSAVCEDPDRPGRVFAWRLTETTDPLGNVVTYEYGTDEGDEPGHRWRQPVLRRIRYVNHGATGFLYRVDLEYEPRDDPFSGYTAGFEIRTALRCTAIATTAGDDPVRRYELAYSQDPHSGVSLLSGVRVVGFDDDGARHEDLPQLTFGYTAFSPDQRRFTAVGGDDPPPMALSGEDVELADVTGDGLPDVLQMNGVVRYWRNLGGGRFDRPRTVTDAPAGLRLADPGVQLLDADGDGRVDLLVTTPALSGTAPLRFDATWSAIRPYRQAPSFNLDDPEIRLLDLNADGVTDVIRAGNGRLECWFHDRVDGWSGPRPARSLDPDGLPLISLTDPRVRWVDMTGDGGQDLVLLHGTTVEYWPNLGHGRFGRRVVMRAGPRLPAHYDPRRLLLGDVDGDGLADLVYAGPDELTLWVNRSGNGWSEPLTVAGCPGPGDDTVRLTDLHGTGTSGVLFSRERAMRFLDLTGGVKPRLLDEVDNHLGVRTRVHYVPSTEQRRRDEVRWRTPMPFVVPVVATMETLDLLSGAKTVTEYRYHHGYWDGAEREFRGFGRVDVFDTVSFDRFHDDDAVSVPPEFFAPPTETRTWHHLGPVDSAGDGRWSTLDCRDEYWDGDRQLLPGDQPASRDALRAMRGRVLRTELYGRDGSALESRPYEVTENSYEVRPEAPRVFFAHEVACRVTRWERGDDPMTVLTYTGDHDAYGQARTQTVVAPPRRTARRRALTAAVVGTVHPDRPDMLATCVTTEFAIGAGIHDRIAQVRRHELVEPPTIDERDPADLPAVLREQARVAAEVDRIFRAPAAGGIRLIGHEAYHYDGEAFIGLDVGEVGSHGLLTRTITLVHTEETLADGYLGWRPEYLGGTAPLPAGVPDAFRADLGLHHEASGWYAETVCHGYDVQLSAAESRGLILQIRDPLGHVTEVTPDLFWLLPAVVAESAELRTTVEHHYRTGRPRRVTDPNGTTRHYRYHPLGLLGSLYLTGADGEGGTPERPEVRYEYDLTAFARAGEPVEVRTISRIKHASEDLPDEAIEIREYSDGAGRLLQRQAPADEAGMVQVTGQQVYDNKGRVVLRYEPFFALGWGYHAAEIGGRAVTIRYDPCGRPVRTVNPDGSERRTLVGTAAARDQPDAVVPSPWVTTNYDENDLAADAPLGHRYTPTVDVLDGFGRELCQLVYGGPDPDADGHLTRNRYDIRGNILERWDEHGRVAFTHAYDLADRTVRGDSIDSGRHITVTDAAGNLVHTRDSRGQVTLRTYDELNRPSTVHAGRDLLTERERLTYGEAEGDLDEARRRHRLGRLWQHRDEAGLFVAEDYDFAGRRTTEVRQVIGDTTIAAAEPAGWTANWAAADADGALDTVTYRTTTRYDALGRIGLMAVPARADGGSRVVEPGYGRSGLLGSVTVDRTVHVRRIVRNARGQPVTVTYGNGLTATSTYGGLTFRLDHTRVASESGAVLCDLTYRYDPVGNVVGIDERTPGCGVASTEDGRDLLRRTFEHDAFYRLAAATGRACTGLGTLRPMDDAPRCGSFPASPRQDNAPDLTTGYREEYTHDPAGNLLDLFYRVTTGADRPSWHRFFDFGDDADNHLASVTEGANGVPLPLSYDESGNVRTEGDSRSYIWDHSGRLTGFRVTAGAGTSVAARYLYAADGTRVKKWVRRMDNPGLDESVTYLGALVEHHRWATGENRELHVMDGTSRIAVLRSGPARPDDHGPEVRYEISDHLGSSAITVDGAGSWVNREEFFPYGETSFGGYARKRYRFTGHERDEESGLNHHGARYYAPGFARWMSPDPVVPRETYNPYAYCRGRPLGAVDGSGRLAFLLVVVVAAMLALTIENTANAPKPADPVYPSMTEAEFAGHAAIALASGGAGGFVERKVAAKLGGTLLARTVGGVAGGTAGGLLAGPPSQRLSDLAHGKRSSAEEYLKSTAKTTMIGIGFGLAHGLTGGGGRGGGVAPRRPTDAELTAKADELSARFAEKVRTWGENGCFTNPRAVRSGAQRSGPPSKVAVTISRKTDNIVYSTSAENRILAHPEMNTEFMSLEGTAAKPRPLNSCADFAGVDKALWAGEAATDLIQSVRDVPTGKLWPACHNCQRTGAGVTFTAGVKQ
jgi:RHS repeat-associated protein